MLGVTRNDLVNESCGCPRNESVSVEDCRGYNTSSNSSSSSKATAQKQCGLIFYLRKYKGLSMLDAAYERDNLSAEIGSYMCSDSTSSCFRLPIDSVVRHALILCVFDYIFVHLMRYVLHRTAAMFDAGVTTTRSQRDLALGYTVSKDVSAIVSDITGHVPGILEHDTDDIETITHGKRNSVLNCYDTPYAKTNFMWKEYADQAYSTHAQFPHAPLPDRAVRAYGDNVPPAGTLNACAKYALPRDDYRIFVPEFWRHLLFSSVYSLVFNGVSLQRLELKQSNFHVDNKFVLTAGLQDMTGTNGYISWTSLPHFLYANRSLAEKYNMAPRKDEHMSFVDIEPITGTVWRRTVRYQRNVAVKSGHVSVGRPVPPWTQGLDRPMPVYWVDSSRRFNEDGLADYKHRIDRLLKAACGGVIGFSIVSVFVFIFAALIGVFTVPGSRVAPTDADSLPL
ncbi:hypothetical protein NP493_1070g00018 [Ridgeia piscesae]|uniref:Uncharacterized protein n=1 Tax=Ridgeia piscesae TaxID=27915 RepID=A0AAD9NLC9_RIDPI|nr:hypothetical protein NP493_1070g00018 [Ridgeia piscesae]